MFRVFASYYMAYVIYTGILIVLVILSLLPLKSKWIFKALFRSAIVLGTAFVLINQLGNEMRMTILRGKTLSLESILNVTLMMAINNILKAIADVGETIIDGLKTGKA